ncbi:MAG: hypothetical protein CMC19_04440 [Flavobacteriaceae bacterium]|nr:hypothetical protein [Flavobacteriaceae bacterium]
MEIQGIIKEIGETKTFGNNGFRKRELILTTQEQYPQHLMIEFVQDKTDLLSAFSSGQDVTVGINLRGREWTNPQGEVKYFNSIQGWRIQANQSASTADSSADEMPPMPPLDQFEKTDQSKDEDFDDLPF